MKKLEPRKQIAKYGAHGSSIRVYIEKGAELVRAQWRERGAVKVKSWPNTPDNRKLAKAWAAAFIESRESTSTETVKVQLTIREIWERYTVAEFAHLRPRTIRNYTDRWRDWERFAGKSFIADQTTLEMVDEYRARRTKIGYAVSQTGEHLKIVKLVYAWAERRELISRNKLRLYRYKIGKEERVKAPEEYTLAEFKQLVEQMDPRSSRQWRAWCALILCGAQGARINAILHLQWDDIDFEAKTIRWRPEWDKMGHDRTQPLTPDAISALYIALGWSQREKEKSPWVFYTPTTSKRAKENPTYGVQAFWRMLILAEKAAGITHKPRRAAHGLRRMSAGNALELTGNIADAMWWIGDTDLRQGKKYLKQRDDRMRGVAEGLEVVTKE